MGKREGKGDREREEKREEGVERRIFLEKIHIYFLTSSDILKSQHWALYFHFFRVLTFGKKIGNLY